MTRRQLLFETDQRTLAQKMQDLIAHPNTLEPVREVARRKLAEYLAKESATNPKPAPSPPTQQQTYKPMQKPVPTGPRTQCNLTEADLDKVFYFNCGFTCRFVFENLKRIIPAPSDILFTRQGLIHIMVPPPYMGLTKQEYSNRLLSAVPGARNITCKYVEEKGYHFTVSLI